MLIRTGLGISKDSQEKWLESWLKEKGLLLFFLSRETIMQTLSREPLDLIVFSEDFLQGAGEEIIRNIVSGIDSPTILVITSPERDDSGAAYLAAGCEMVIPSTISSSILKETIENLIQKRLELQTFRPGSILRAPSIDDFASEHEAVKPFISVARKVVNSNSSLLILGETGVGKERLALAIHSESQRGRGPFVPINCAALPENLLESELFGHEQGAFTGAIRARRGAFELSHKGTIFLDEVGDMPLHLQAKLLRVLQNKEFKKIGGEKKIQVDVRVMAATNHDLMKEVEEGRFRRDLFYRLGVVSIVIPPLRIRPEDIVGLVRGFIDHLVPRSSSARRSVSKEAMEALLAYDWPGNVRELMNVIERAILLGDGKIIQLEDLPAEMVSFPHKKKIDSIGQESEQMVMEPQVLQLKWKDSRSQWLDRFEKAYFEALIQRCSGKVGEAARQAGITPRALHQKLSRHGIVKEKFK